jgi:hypothetical protein
VAKADVKHSTSFATDPKLLSIAKPQDMQALKEFMKENQVNYPVVVLRSKELPELFENSRYIPRSYFIEQGRETEGSDSGRING